jgi:integrase
MRKTITKRAVGALRPGQIISDQEIAGFVVRRLPSGRLSYGFRYTQDGRRRWIAIGVGIAPEAARRAAQAHAGKAAQGHNPMTEREDRRRRTLSARTLNQVLDDFIRGHVEARGLRSAAEYKSLFDRHVRPRLGTRPVAEIKRLEIVEMLDQIADAKSIRSRDGKARCVADKALAFLRSALNWHASRDDEFRSPIVAGMARTSFKELARDRVLSDDEIRSVWQALDRCQPDPYVRVVRALLLSAARLDEIRCLRWAEIDGDKIVVPGARVKTKVDHTLPMTSAVAALIGERERGSGDYVFSANGGYSPFDNFSGAKRALDNAINAQRTSDGLKPMPPWRFHDLRRTARSLMSRAGVSTDIAERVLGHVMPGVRGVYDRHAYLDEKRDALERLSALVTKITNPPAENVVPLRANR